MEYQPIPLRGVDDLRKLAPIAGQRGLALRLEERDGSLFCVGLMTLQDNAIFPDPIDLVIRVNGPGDLWCGEFGYMLKLKEGRIRHIESTHRVRAVHDWFRGLGQQMADRWIASRDQTTAEPGTDKDCLTEAVRTASSLVSFFWSSMLDSALDLRHGGMFVVLDDPDTAPMKTKYLTGATAHRQVLSDYFCVIMDSHASGRRDETLLIENWEKIKSSFSSFAHMSTLDGSVVFDRSMMLRSFGSEIRVNDLEISKLGKALLDAHTGKELPESQVMNYGTRHRSAIRLCQAVESALAFVVSQDGDLRVFHSDKVHVYRWDNLNAFDYASKW